jgi:nitrogen fixation NifU-like protein
MTDDLYQAELLDHYHHPQNYGSLPNATCRIVEKNSSCGDTINLDLIVNGQGDSAIVFDIKFNGTGCCVSMAAASKLTEYAKGKSIGVLKQIDFIFMQDLIGAVISPGRIKCLTLSAKALTRGLETALLHPREI